VFLHGPDTLLLRRKVRAMKNLLALAMLLSLGMFTLGCEKPKDKAPEGAPADAAPAEEAPK
jgi:hypothetical protein